jgi:hypothetical protein
MVRTMTMPILSHVLIEAKKAGQARTSLLREGAAGLTRREDRPPCVALGEYL